MEPGYPCGEGVVEGEALGVGVGCEVVAPAFDDGCNVLEVVEGGEVGGWCGAAVGFVAVGLGVAGRFEGLVL